jgi:hypothetical protein
MPENTKYFAKCSNCSYKGNEHENERQADFDASHHMTQNPTHVADVKVKQR